MIVGGYSMDLYCDDPRHDEVFRLSKGQTGSRDAQFVGQSYADCARQARRRGWLLRGREQTCICPTHRQN